jgi:DNA-binding NarL/FixJ family response regulator
LARIEPLSSLGPVAGSHHEQLDGGGYHRGVQAADLGIPARILATADRYVLMEHGDDQRSLAELDSLAGVTLDRDCVTALRSALGTGQPGGQRAVSNPAKLTDREIEVLRLVSDGLTAREVAERLVISRKTAEHHLENIYNKLGVTSKTAAAVYAVSSGLI